MRPQKGVIIMCQSLNNSWSSAVIHVWITFAMVEHNERYLQYDCPNRGTWKKINIQSESLMMQTKDSQVFLQTEQ